MSTSRFARSHGASLDPQTRGYLDGLNRAMREPGFVHPRSTGLDAEAFELKAFIDDTYDGESYLNEIRRARGAPAAIRAAVARASRGYARAYGGDGFNASVQSLVVDRYLAAGRAKTNAPALNRRGKPYLTKPEAADAFVRGLVPYLTARSPGMYRAAWREFVSALVDAGDARPAADAWAPPPDPRRR